MHFLYAKMSKFEIIGVFSYMSGKGFAYFKGI